MSDIGDLRGVFPTPLRWNAEQGILGRKLYDPDVASPVSRSRSLKILYRHPSPAPNGSRWAAKSRGYRKPRRGRRPDAQRVLKPR